MSIKFCCDNNNSYESKSEKIGAPIGLIFAGPVTYDGGMSYLCDEWALKEQFWRKILKKNFTDKFT